MPAKMGGRQFVHMRRNYAPSTLNKELHRKLLWETRLTDVPSDSPISYTVNGKQMSP
jgi:hypothetical protein